MLPGAKPPLERSLSWPKGSQLTVFRSDFSAITARALNPSRRGVLGQLVAYVTALEVEPITGRPYKPTTQGKNERYHQTLFRWLDKQPLAESLEELQEQVDRFDQVYNTERPHQGLPGRITPAKAWEATLKAKVHRPAARNACYCPTGSG